jgi:hypothetical protein
MIYNLTNLEALIRNEMDETSATRFTPAEILAACNDGYKEVASRAFCHEVVQDVVTVPGSPLIHWSGIKVLYAAVMSEDAEAAYVDTTSVVFTDTGDVVWNGPTAADWIGLGVCRIDPSLVGTAPLEEDISYPQFFFPWGNCIYVEPVPTVKYLVRLFTAQYPDTAMINGADICEDLPEEFRECVVYFACYVLSMKYRQWQQMVFFYNRYIELLKQKKQKFLQRSVDRYDNKKLPVTVQLEVVK